MAVQKPFVRIHLDQHCRPLQQGYFQDSYDLHRKKMSVYKINKKKL